MSKVWRPWGEGEQPSELLRDGGLKPIDQARGVMVRTVEIHGGGPLGAMTGAKLLTVCPTLPVALKAADAAALICEFAGMDRDLLDATTLGQSADATAVAAGGTAETKALVAARDKLRRDFGTALGHMPNETILRAQAILTNLDSQGLFKAWAQVGAALRAAIVHDARVAAAPSPSPAPAPAPEAPDTPRTALIKEMRAEMAKLKRALDLREASGGAPAPAPAPGGGRNGGGTDRGVWAQGLGGSPPGGRANDQRRSAAGAAGRRAGRAAAGGAHPVRRLRDTGR